MSAFLLSLSPQWLFGLGFIFAVILFLCIRRIRSWLIQIFIPYKKGKSYWCRVTAISDGDTLTCYRLNLRRSQTKLRFAYIDAPESSQAYGLESQRLVKKMVYRKIVKVKITDIDRYGRCVGEIYRFNRSMNEEMIKRGAAWVYEEYVKDQRRKKRLLSLQDQAKRNKRGLWKATRPVRPSTYRKQN